MEEIKTLKDHVYSYIAEQIRTGGMHPNQRVSETAICEALKISSTPVREALIQLTAEGVLEKQNRKGFVIKMISEEEVAQLYEIIGALDGYAAKKACDRLNEQDFANLDFYVNSIDLAIKAQNSQMYYEQQQKFHQLYIDKCGNDSLIAELSRLHNKLLKNTSIDLNKEENREILLSTNMEHKEILRLFTKKAKDELFTYISETHWRPGYAAYDAKASIATSDTFTKK